MDRAEQNAARFKNLAQRLPCPKCGAAPGDRCRGRGLYGKGKTHTGVHAQRIGALVHQDD